MFPKKYKNLIFSQSKRTNFLKNHLSQKHPKLFFRKKLANK